MTQFRVSEYLENNGVSARLQGFIFFSCLNINRLNKADRERIRQLCNDVAGNDSKALYRFLTDGSVNHEYIKTTYFVPKNKLFELKNKFYKAWAEGER